MNLQPLRILFWMDDGGDGLPGGNVVHLRQTASALERTGCTVRTSTEAQPDLRGVDVVHGFNLSHDRMRSIHAAGIRVALTPLYWPYSFRSGSAGPPPNLRARLGRLSLSARFSRAAMRGEYQQFAHGLLGASHTLMLSYEAADLLLPNSHSEAQAIRTELGVSTPMHVVPNAANPELFAPPPSNRERAGIVMAARIEPFKNQLGLIKACAGLGVRLTLAGSVHPHHGDYGKKCRQAADSNVVFAGLLPQDDLAQLLHSAKVHALPSWYEIAALASLEAALAGCAVVTTDRGSAREYFGDMASYCDPASVESIRQGVTEALAGPSSSALATAVRERFTWERAASETLRAYHEMLK